MRPRVLSGIQPTADSFHLGNYLGAARRRVVLERDPLAHRAEIVAEVERVSGRLDAGKNARAHGSQPNQGQTIFFFAKKDPSTSRGFFPAAPCSPPPPRGTRRGGPRAGRHR